MLRTHNCGELRISNVGQEVTLTGWVHAIRDLGGIRFLLLRDRYGITQVVPEADPSVLDSFGRLGSEYVIQVRGVVRKRPEEAVRSDLPTGEIEVVAHEIKVLSEAETPPIYVDREDETSEELRLRYRYLDLRKARMTRNIVMRHRIVQAVREYLNNNDFLEIETPMLIKSTPEGARDFIVPSRLKRGKFYALPQSPQLLKQILMVAGFDRYYQIARCFRDEDLRADRQPEFSQIDIEMSFVEREDVMAMSEGLVAYVIEKVFGKRVSIPFRRLSYEEAMNRYGSDKPLTHFGMEIEDVTELFHESRLNFVQDALKNGAVVRGIVAPSGAASLSRKKVSEYEQIARSHGLGGLIWLKRDGDLKSSIDKYDRSIALAVAERLGLEADGFALLSVGEKEHVSVALGELRLKVAQELGLIKNDVYDFLWVIDFPMFEWSEEENRLVARHHPFTMPRIEDIEEKKDPLEIKALSYDLVMNGVEIAGGSIRIHRSDIQRWVFEKIGLSKEEAESRFGFLLQAFKYGVPPHGGIAFGLDRFVMLLLKERSIREVIAFPKTASGADLMMGAPSDVSDELLQELGIRIVQEQEVL
ncbi:MAG: aspartyl-tRNA synthetase [Thermotogota bacterium]|nr:aspartyl-tRNA synthetase [Thermotogota bacterium]MDK2864262.1 aspartyl-tRNA synthetase [Thermotogota bacterium]